MIWLRWIVCALAALTMVSCSGGDSSNTAPSPTNPNLGPTNPVNPGPNPRDPNIPPGFSTSVIFMNWALYSGIADIFDVPFNGVGSATYPTLVNDPRLAVNITGNNSTVTGEILLGIETNTGSGNPTNGGYTYLTIPAFYASVASNRIYTIFADDIGVVLADGAVSNGTWTGTVYNRNRNTDECKKQTQTVYYYIWQNNQWVLQTQVNDITDYQGCINFMSPSNSAVIQVGSFTKTNVSQWVH